MDPSCFFLAFPRLCPDTGSCGTCGCSLRCLVCLLFMQMMLISCSKLEELEELLLSLGCLGCHDNTQVVRLTIARHNCLQAVYHTGMMCKCALIALIHYPSNLPHPMIKASVVSDGLLLQPIQYGENDTSVCNQQSLSRVYHYNSPIDQKYYYSNRFKPPRHLLLVKQVSYAFDLSWSKRVHRTPF